MVTLFLGVRGHTGFGCDRLLVTLHLGVIGHTKFLVTIFAHSVFGVTIN